MVIISGVPIFRIFTVIQGSPNACWLVYAKHTCTVQHATHTTSGVPPAELLLRSTVTSCMHVHFGSLNKVPFAHGLTMLAFSSKYSIGDAVFRSLQPIFRNT